MPLSLAAIDALLADNTSGDISAADMRTIIRDLHRRQAAPYSISDAADVWWEGDAAGMTTVTVTGSQTITEKEGYLSVKYSGQASGDFNGLFKAHTFATGDSFAVRIRSLGTSEDYTMTGLAFTDGTTGGSNVVCVYPYRQTANGQLTLGHGTLDNFATNTWSIPGIYLGGAFNDGIYARLTYTSANTFTGQYSPDGASWSVFGQTTASKTMTPTHFGVIWSKFGGTVESVASFGPICKLA